MKERRVLLITGASSEFGCELIREIAGNYEVILAHYFHESKTLERLKEDIGDKLVLLQSDFTDLKSVESMVEDIEKKGDIPDHIVHLPAQKVNAKKFHKTELEQYMLGFTTSVTSIALILKRFIPRMSKQKYGKIVFMLTSYTLNTPPKYQAPYITAKYALLGLMRDISNEYADRGIMVNGISPDMMETKFLSDMPDLIVQQNAANNPMRRNLTVKDVVPTVCYLLSKSADTVTGQNIGITGGN